jgi:hypothetical protein
VANSANIEDRLRKLEALFARGATPGERAAAGAALNRFQSRLDLGGGESREPEIELQFSMPDAWALRLFIAICRKHGVKPYRYRRQRRTTVVVRVQQSVFDQTVHAEFQALHHELGSYFQEIVDHLISDAMHSDGNDDNLEIPQLTP